MFLQNFFSWKPVRAIAAFMAILVMATACQETAQVINKPMAANESIAQSEQAQETAVAQNTPLSEAELALAKKVDSDKDIAVMNQMGSK